VADAELIIHGATEPGATVNIAGKPITLKSDGTFHLRVPFSEELIDYLITVSAANGKQTTSLHKQFSQETLESK
jgi:phosphate transport system substrate-binding protein